MKLRDSIRAPVRYGDGEAPEIPTARNVLRIGLDDGDDDNVELSDLGRPRPQTTRNSTTKPFDPNMPPAAFPSLDRPHANPQVRRLIIKMPQSRRHSGTDLPPPAAAAPQQKRRVTWCPTTVDMVPMDNLENHVASNNDSNPIYVRNMAIMAGAALKDPFDTSDEDEDTAMSDNENLPDPTQVLLSKVKVYDL
jgi:hypothetical protein